MLLDIYKSIMITDLELEVDVQKSVFKLVFEFEFEFGCGYLEQCYTYGFHLTNALAGCTFSECMTCEKILGDLGVPRGKPTLYSSTNRIMTHQLHENYLKRERSTTRSPKPEKRKENH